MGSDMPRLPTRTFQTRKRSPYIRPRHYLHIAGCWRSFDKVMHLLQTSMKISGGWATKELSCLQPSGGDCTGLKSIKKKYTFLKNIRRSVSSNSLYPSNSIEWAKRWYGSQRCGPFKLYTASPHFGHFTRNIHNLSEKYGQSY